MNILNWLDSLMRILEELTFKWGRSVILIQIKNARRI